jgi:hypothetical protein
VVVEFLACGRTLVSLSLSHSLERLVQVFGSAPRCLASGSGSGSLATVAPAATATAAATEFDTPPEFDRRLSGPAPGPFLAILVHTYLLYSYMIANSEREGGSGAQAAAHRAGVSLSLPLPPTQHTPRNVPGHLTLISKKLCALLPFQVCVCACVCVCVCTLRETSCWRMVTDVGCRRCGRICGRSD